jgi:hypothetical protein
MYKPMTQRIALAVLFITSLAISIAHAQEPKVELNALIQETQKMGNEPNSMMLVWWIPEEFWEVAMAQDPTVTPEAAQQLRDAVKPYVLVAVVDGKIGPFGGATYQPEPQVRASLSIKDNAGNSYTPLPDNQISGDVRNLLAVIRPMLANMIGPMGENMNFYAFNANDAQGKRIADPRSEGKFTVIVRDQEMAYRLPLGSLLPRQTCPKCSESLTGSFKFCPYDGTKLGK